MNRIFYLLFFGYCAQINFSLAAEKEKFWEFIDDEEDLEEEPGFQGEWDDYSEDRKREISLDIVNSLKNETTPNFIYKFSEKLFVELMKFCQEHNVQSDREKLYLLSSMRLILYAGQTHWLSKMVSELILEEYEKEKFNHPALANKHFYTQAMYFSDINITLLSGDISQQLQKDLKVKLALRVKPTLRELKRLKRLNADFQPTYAIIARVSEFLFLDYFIAHAQHYLTLNYEQAKSLRQKHPDNAEDKLYPYLKTIECGLHQKNHPLVAAYFAQLASISWCLESPHKKTYEPYLVAKINTLLWPQFSQLKITERSGEGFLAVLPQDLLKVIADIFLEMSKNQ